MSTPDNVYAIPVRSLESVMYQRPLVGEYRIDRDWATYAVVTQNWDEPESRRYYLVDIVVPKGSIVSVTYDRRRQYGRKYRIRTDNAVFTRIADIADPDTEVSAIRVKKRDLKSNKLHRFDFNKDTLFIVPNALEAQRLVQYISRYMQPADCDDE